MRIATLRRATAADHDAVENALPLTSPDLRLEDYVGTLERLYGVIAAWERHAAEKAPEWLKPGLRARARAPMLLEDIAALGGRAPGEVGPAMESFQSEPALLGGMYVIEGSKLGGQFVAKHVSERFGLSDGRGYSFFRGYAERTGAMWKELVQEIETRVPDAEEATVIESAQRMFHVFDEWMAAGEGTRGAERGKP